MVACILQYAKNNGIRDYGRDGARAHADLYEGIEGIEGIESIKTMLAN